MTIKLTKKELLKKLEKQGKETYVMCKNCKGVSVLPVAPSDVPFICPHCGQSISFDVIEVIDD